MREPGKVRGKDAALSLILEHFEDPLAIHSGSISLCRYRLLGGSGRISLAKLSQCLGPHKAGPLKLSGVTKEELVGWVRPLGIEKTELPPDAPWTMDDCQVDDGFVLRLRIEQRKVPAQLLQLIYKQRFFELQAKSGKTPGPKERRELKETLKTELMGRALPALSHLEAFWRDATGELMLFTTGKKARQRFEQAFQQTFADPLDLTLVRIDPPLLGLSKDQWEDSLVASATLSRLSSATPVAFAEQIYP